MKRGGGLHPARPDCWPPTKRPRATPGGLIAASVTCLSRREGVPPCLRTSPPLGGTLEVHRTSWRIPFPRHACSFLGTRVPRRLGVARSDSSPKAAQALGCSLTPGLRISFDRVTCMARAASVPGLWALGFLLCAAFVFGSGLRLGVGFVNPASPGWGLGWVCLGTVCGVVPLVSAVCGVRGRGSVSACLGDVCGFVRASLASRCFRFRRAVWACVLGPGLGCAQPFVAGLSGCVFCAFFFWCPCPGPCGPCPPIPFLSGWAAGSFFFFVVFVCMFRCPFSRWAAVPGLVLPVLAGWSPRASSGVLSSVPSGGGGVWPPLVVLAGGFMAVGCFRVPPPPPSVFLFFLGGGAACSSLCLPWLAHALSRIQCCLPGCCWRLRSVWPCSGPMGRVGYVHGGLGAPSCRVRS